jgi:hypothetical protein
VTFVVKLSNTEIATCCMIGNMRSIVARSNNVEDKKMASLSGINVDEDGVIGEYAFCKEKNIFMDLVPSPRSGGYDCLYKGYRIDIKTTRHQNGRLLATTKVNTDIDIFVLAIINGTEVTFPGFALHAELYREENLRDLGHGTGYALDQDQLRKWKTDWS